MGRRISWIIAALVLFFLVGGLSFATDMYFDWLWFSALGKTPIFTTVLFAKSIIFALVLLGVFLFLYLNLWFANRGAGSIRVGIPTPEGQITAYDFSRETVRKGIGVAALAVGLLVAARSSAAWETVWRWLNRVDFGKTDPVFSRDIGFYFFSYPAMVEAVHLGLLLTFLAAAGALVLYYFKEGATLRGFGRQRRVSMHVSLLGALFFVLLAANAWLGRFDVLFSRHELMFGANYADLHARLPLLSILAGVALVAAALWVYNAFSAGNKAAVTAVGIYLLALIAGGAYAPLLQKFVVGPNELSRESPQIEHNIEATLHAYDLDEVQDRSLSGDKALTPADIEANSATIRSIRLWDHEPLLDAFSQIQEIRTYYDFVSVDNDRYQLKGGPQQMMLSPRELDSTSLPERNWINEHLSYTHGYGLTLGPVNRVTPEGLPVLEVKDIPPAASQSVFKITRPEIYYGELTKSYVVVKTGAKEFDYPSGEENVYTSYQGTGGIPIHSFLRKVLFAFYFKDANIVLSPLLNNDSRFMYFRDIKSRFSRLAPFLQLDKDPYMVISGGKLYWIQDAYTRGDRYPYSTPMQGVGNYIRNSVKMVLDAYNGSVDMYISDPDDPVIQVYQKIFPGVFRPLSDMPQDLRRHIRYPEDIFRIQTYIYSVYHMANPQVFYNKEDLWEIPVLASASGQSAMMSPYYTIMRLPQEQKEEFILMLPFTPGRKDNLSAWMVARSDGEHYGQLVVYRFPKQKLVYGPRQIVARINQDADISRQLSLWDQRGSQVIQGNLLVIPIEEGLIYVRPLYLRAESGKIPELKRVIVAYENKIAMEETLEASIARIFQGEGAPAVEPMQPGAATAVTGEGPSAAAGPSLLRQAREAYDRAMQAQREGDWAQYGEQIKKLGEILQQLKRNGS